MCIKTGFSSVSPYVLKVGRRIGSPVLKRLQTVMTCGLTPQKLALTLCLGAAIGVLPLLWGTTLICIMLAHLLRLNQMALQSVNYLLYPLQLVLLIPFFKLGAWLFPWGPKIPVNVLASLLSSPSLSSLNIIAWITIKSLAAWLITALPVALFAYLIMRLIQMKSYR